MRSGSHPQWLPGDETERETEREGEERETERERMVKSDQERAHPQ